MRLLPYTYTHWMEEVPVCMSICLPPDNCKTCVEIPRVFYSKLLDIPQSSCGLSDGLLEVLTCDPV